MLPDFVPSVKSHGNSKQDTPFHPTWPSMKQEIAKCELSSPKHTVATLSANVGGVLKASAPGQLPRNEKQVSYFKPKVKRDSIPGICRDAAADDLFVMMQKAAYTDDSGTKFVRAVNAAPEPAIVLATDRQLNDARFCTSSFEFSPLTVDPTF